MAASSFSVAATVSPSSSTYPSLHFFTQKPKFSVVQHFSLSTNNTHFINFKFNSIKPKKFKPHFSISSFFSSINRSSIRFSSSSVSDGAEVFQVNEEAAFSPSVKPTKLKPHYPISSFFSSFNRSSIHFSPSAVSDGAEVVGVDEEAALSAEEEIEEDEEKEDGESVEKEGDGGVDEPQSIKDGRLYVGNMPFSMTASQLSEIFAEAGKVVNVEIVYDRVTVRSRGFAFVTMGSVEEAKEAIRLFDGSQVGGRTVKVNFPEVPRGGEREVMRAKIRSTNQGFVDSPHKLYASNLSWNLTSKALNDAFSDQPGFLSARVVYERDSGRSRGFGFITFSSAEAMNNVLNTMNEVELEGRPLRLSLTRQRAPLSSPPVVETSPENDSEHDEILSSLSS
ncbi:hypothetical protein HAX54_012523 [Datura stramonium]|uniref:RRM domain-containing protein n=1 Tax=Datura stramonium TaxID=4076 RepID=A0ABS8RY56_DATST|nr:hypothetical protein [Datura stramonium]